MQKLTILDFQRIEDTVSYWQLTQPIDSLTATIEPYAFGKIQAKIYELNSQVSAINSTTVKTLDEAVDAVNRYFQTYNQ